MSTRLKFFSKRKITKSVGKYIKDHPVLQLSAGSLAVGIANYATNTRRRNESIEQHNEQIKALKDLNNNIVINSSALRDVNEALKNNTLKLDSSNKRSVEKNNKLLILFRKKNKEKEKKYSIQDGGFKGRKIEPKKSSISTGAGIGAVGGSIVGIAMANNLPIKLPISASIGAIIGAGVGALSVWLNNMAEESIFNQGLATKANSYTLIKNLESIYLPKEEDVIEESKTTSRNMNTVHTTTVRKSSPRSTISPIGTLFSIDNDPKKHVVNLILRGNVMLLLLNKPNQLELKKLNGLLDKYCSKYRLADYSSTKLDSNIYLVEVNVVGNTAASLVYNIIESGIKVNILTTDRFGIKNI